MTRTNLTMQPEAVMPTAARVRPVMLNGWLDGVASTFGDITGTQGRHADTAKRSTRHLGRIST